MTFELLAFEVAPSSGIPIYRQLMDQVKRLVASEHLKPGDPLPSVRNVATALAVNPMTISKAYSLLEAEGVLERERGKGMKVAATKNVAKSTEQRLEILQPSVDSIIAEAKQLDIGLEQLTQQIEKSF
ncbi:MAG: GntR family transcriptional regulator [Gammaproteobacteria bacterium]|nr:GntR family transcriptional regulator [Gammaproteobacteria bacterium]